MSLSESMDSLVFFGMSWVGILASVTGLLIIYGVTLKFSIEREHRRIDRIGATLKLYTSAESALISALEQNNLTREDRQILFDRMLACRSAPYITTDLLMQISACAEEPDTARLPLLLKTLQRECERLCMERDKLLHRSESPGWGYALWKTIRPAVPFVFAIVILVLLRRLFFLIYALSEPSSTSLLELVNPWSEFGSALFSLLLLYPAVMGGNRPNVGSVLLRLWSVLIAALYLLNLLGESFAPYILVLQLLLFLAGFRLTGSKPRKSRPFAGHYQKDSQELLSPAIAESDAPDTSYPSDSNND
ncbi:hypothetical protein [Paenibacillus apis]|uniref:Uncharacterized protein n=1 Tax=Paenibacillus apis TaxID=1792174 RepID=A0A919Y333_9BACL|nr:hypothetical protein [Paenibacillus apis]GIO44001.1 hypothetical protein J41TS4_37590 [Paenibacillus apis]